MSLLPRRRPCDCDFYDRGPCATEGAWAKWRYWQRAGWGRRSLPLPWARGWMCIKCQRSQPRDGDGKPLDVDVVYLKRKPAERFLTFSAEPSLGPGDGDEPDAFAGQSPGA